MSATTILFPADGLDVVVDAWQERAEAQLGLIARKQLLKRGVSRHRIDDLVKRGQLHRFRPGVLRLSGAPTTWKTHVMGACLQAMPGAAASSGTAGVLLGLEGVRSRGIEIATTRCIKAKQDVSFHRVSRLPPEQLTSAGPIPVTVVERTILDLAGHGRRWEVDSAIDHAIRSGMTTLDLLGSFLADEARSGTSGVRLLRERIARREGQRGSVRSPLERTVLDLIIESGLPQPELNVPIRGEDGFYALVDMYYPAQRLVLEIQSYERHSSLTSFNRDAERLSELTVRGYKVLEVTHEQVKHRPFALIERLRHLGISQLKERG